MNDKVTPCVDSFNTIYLVWFWIISLGTLRTQRFQKFSLHSIYANWIFHAHLMCEFQNNRLKLISKATKQFYLLFANVSRIINNQGIDTWQQLNYYCNIKAKQDLTYGIQILFRPEQWIPFLCSYGTATRR